MQQASARGSKLHFVAKLYCTKAARKPKQRRKISRRKAKQVAPVSMSEQSNSPLTSRSELRRQGPLQNEPQGGAHHLRLDHSIQRQPIPGGQLHQLIASSAHSNSYGQFTMSQSSSGHGAGAPYLGQGRSPDPNFNNLAISSALAPNAMSRSDYQSSTNVLSHGSFAPNDARVAPRTQRPEMLVSAPEMVAEVPRRKKKKHRRRRSSKKGRHLREKHGVKGDGSRLQTNASQPRNPSLPAALRDCMSFGRPDFRQLFADAVIDGESTLKNPSRVIVLL